MILRSNEKYLMDLNKFIHSGHSAYEYHMKHIELAKRYALVLNMRLNANVSSSKLAYAALVHDILKERSSNPDDPEKIWNGISIPRDLNRYVRSNLDVLEEYGLDDYFNSSCQLHALAAGIFLRKEMDITDTEILYPVMFHSCPIISVYEELPYRTRTMVDIILLADKLSSNYLRINMKKTSVRVDLDQVVFGSTGMELNYSLGLYLARLIGQGKSEEKQCRLATEYYYKRLCQSNPLIFENYDVKKLGGSKIWPERKSQVWRKH